MGIKKTFKVRKTDPSLEMEIKYLKLLTIKMADFFFHPTCMKSCLWGISSSHSTKMCKGVSLSAERRMHSRLWQDKYLCTCNVRTL